MAGVRWAMGKGYAPMSVEYAPRGLVGLFTPQANTTVEPEMAILTPRGMATLNARMTSAKGTISERLVDYMDQFPGLLAQYANAPLDVVAIACTGASYLIGTEREDALLADIAARSGAVAMTGASASVDALRLLGARRIALVSPYNSALDQQSAGYWTARGFEVAAEANVFRESTDFHPIYSLGGDATDAALADLEGADIDAVLMLGTGMPTLGAIARRPRVGHAPVLSCMLAIGWRCAAACDPASHDREALLGWIEARPWRAMLEMRL
jgi:maleate isomerase